MSEDSTAGAPIDPRLASLTDQCVMCGLCLPHCPTYRLEAIEAESPRGRIALARALTLGALQATPTMLEHLDRCLGCLSCQKVCPSQVNYDEILVRTRSALADVPRRKDTLPGFVGRVLRDPIRATALARIASILRAGHWLPRLAGIFPRRWRKLVAATPALPQPARFVATRVSVPTRGRVGLFRGCVASVYDHDTLAAAQRLLEVIGYEVFQTPETTCCGALERHHGAATAAAQTAATTRATFEAACIETVLVAASGCHGDLCDHVFSGSLVQVIDVHAFLAAEPAFATLRFRTLPKRVALHLPCTQINVVGALEQIHALLARIPELTLLPLPEQPRCCGAAGSYFLEQPDFAERLRSEKLDQAATLGPDLLLTTNIGCRIHLGNGLRERAQPLRVLHPLALLAEQLDN